MNLIELQAKKLPTPATGIGLGLCNREKIDAIYINQY